LLTKKKKKKKKRENKKERKTERKKNGKSAILDSRGVDPARPGEFALVCERVAEIIFWKLQPTMRDEISIAKHVESNSRRRLRTIADGRNAKRIQEVRV